MTPKEKAKELVRMFAKKSNNLKQRTDWNYDKQCALIAVDEIIGQWEIIDVYLADGNGQLNQNLKYWYTVKQEIQNL